jgi:hypothetical protein
MSSIEAIDNYGRLSTTLVMLGQAVFLWLRLHGLRFEDLLIAVHGDSGVSVRVCCLGRAMALSRWA